ncbi:unnamed protein product [Ranitomeya imitator]|uniref:Uncharacterized protein n=1 Tax=Ranitomeya imitator TaxID=111125 RepID=A0ABN9LI69_9NEOB|nr:unnamed protein product [Ranitomeya imitator]
MDRGEENKAQDARGTWDRYGDCYVWNKVTTCIHNILSGRRWIEHYGEITIRNTKSSASTCKMTFIKVLCQLIMNSIMASQDLPLS